MKRLLSLLFTLFCPHTYTAKQGVVVVPVADIIGNRLCIPTAHNILGLTYGTLPHATGPIPQLNACMRLHQLLFNEVVEILEEGKDVEKRSRHENKEKMSNTINEDY